MKRYPVLIAAPAEAEIEAAYLHIYRDSPVNAARWRLKLLRAAGTLQRWPKRCQLAPENGPFAFEIRQLIFGEYRLLFTIHEGAAVILHVRHGARKRMRSDEVIPP